MWKEFKEVLYKLREESIPVMKRRNTTQKWVTKHNKFLYRFRMQYECYNLFDT